MSRGWWRWADRGVAGEVESPHAVGTTGSGKERSGVSGDGYLVFLEEDVTIGVGEFSEREQGVVSESGEDVAGSGLGRKFG